MALDVTVVCISKWNAITHNANDWEHEQDLGDRPNKTNYYARFFPLFSVSLKIYATTSNVISTSVCVCVCAVHFMAKCFEKVWQRYARWYCRWYRQTLATDNSAFLKFQKYYKAYKPIATSSTLTLRSLLLYADLFDLCIFYLPKKMCHRWCLGKKANQYDEEEVEDFSRIEREG